MLRIKVIKKIKHDKSDSLIEKKNKRKKNNNKDKCHKRLLLKMKSTYQSRVNEYHIWLANEWILTGNT